MKHSLLRKKIKPLLIWREGVWTHGSSYLGSGAGSPATAESCINPTTVAGPAAVAV